MRQPGYYWAKRLNHNEQIVEITNSGRIWIVALEQYFCEPEFEWISDTPIQVEKMPVKYLDDHYYIVQHNAKNKIIARYDSQVGLFCSTELFSGGFVQRYSVNVVKIISGPFSLEQLTKLKPVVQ